MALTGIRSAHSLTHWAVVSMISIRNSMHSAGRFFAWLEFFLFCIYGLKVLRAAWKQDQLTRGPTSGNLIWHRCITPVTEAWSRADTKPDPLINSTKARATAFSENAPSGKALMVNRKWKHNAGFIDMRRCRNGWDEENQTELVSSDTEEDTDLMLLPY